MIHQVLPTIINESNTFLKRQFNEMEDKVVLSDLVNQDGSLGFLGENRLICSLFNIEQERINLNAQKVGALKKNPPINLNLYLLFSAYFPGNYVEALKFLSALIGFFQGKQVFTPHNTPGLPSLTSKITMELLNLDLHQLSNLWATMGAKVVPSVAFKMKMVPIDQDMILEEIPEITKVDTHSGSIR